MHNFGFCGLGMPYIEAVIVILYITLALFGG